MSRQTTRTLRIFLSHTVSGQLWQTGGDVAANFETGEGIPAWAFKIEGRLLEVRSVSLAAFHPTLSLYRSRQTSGLEIKLLCASSRH